MTFDQEEFNFATPPGENGYSQWQEELDARKRAFELRWGVVLGKKVRLQLRSLPHAIEGSIHLIDDTSTSQQNQPQFKIGDRDFSAHEIESLVALDTEP